MQDFFRELKDRKVIKVGIAYVVGAFVVMESADIVFPAIGLPETAITLVIGLLAVGLPLALKPKDPATRYNATCFYAKNGEIEKALDCLENSVTSRTWIENDPDLNALRDDQRYKALVESLPT